MREIFVLYLWHRKANVSAAYRDMLPWQLLDSDKRATNQSFHASIASMYFPNIKLVQYINVNIRLLPHSELAVTRGRDYLSKYSIQ
jgi:hypothetical protein